jgi:predicted metal-dependent hydrolase
MTSISHKLVIRLKPSQWIAKMTKIKKQTALEISAQMDIPGRKMEFKFDLDSLPRYWHGGDIFKTTYMNALSSLFPEGERMFIDAVRDHRHLITDEKLLEQVKGFIKQEAIHGHEHSQFNKYLDKLGYPASKIEAFEKKEKSWMRKSISARIRLAITSAVEHFTAIMADDILTNPKSTEGMDEKFKALWKWHAIEETEHKAVAFDVYQQTGGGYVLRVFAMFMVTIMFCAKVSAVQAIYLWKDGKLFSPKVWWQGLKMYFGKNSLIKNIWSDYVDYYRPSFHPWDHDNRALLQEWIDKGQHYKTV